jgi:hypothetical protein
VDGSAAVTDPAGSIIKGWYAFIQVTGTAVGTEMDSHQASSQIVFSVSIC